MRRRSFLRAMAAAIPAAGVQHLLVQQASAQPSAAPPLPAWPPLSAAPPPGAVHAVGAGEDCLGETHSLGFSSITFKVPTDDTGGSLFVIEHAHLTGGGPCLHLHWNLEAWFYVMEGEVVFQVGGERLQLGAGESVLAPRLVAHTFSPVGTTPGRLLIAFTPAGKMEQYFRDAEREKHLAGESEFLQRYEMERVGPSPFGKHQEL